MQIVSKHSYGNGWYGFEWTPKNNQSQVVHVNFDYRLPTNYTKKYPIGRLFLSCLLYSVHFTNG